MSELVSKLPATKQQATSTAVRNYAPAAELSQPDSETKLFQKGSIQFKLAIGSPDDPLEHEADSIAESIIQMPEQNFVHSNGKSQPEAIQRKPLSTFIQRKEISNGSVASENFMQQINSTKGNGNALDMHTQSFMQSRIGADFNQVKIHTDPDAASMNRGLNAKAFTVGNDIYFNEGQFAPNTNDGKRLLAHELVHVMQQSNMLQRKLGNPEVDLVRELKDLLESGRLSSAYLLLSDHISWGNYQGKKAWLASNPGIRYLFLKKIPAHLLVEFYSESELILLLPDVAFEVIDCWYQTNDDKEVLYTNHLALFDKLVSSISPYTGEEISNTVSKLISDIGKKKYEKDAGNTEFLIIHLLAPTVERKIKFYKEHQKLFETVVEKFEPYSGISIQTFETLTDTNEVDRDKARELYAILKNLPEKNRRAFLDTALFAGGLESDKDAEVYYKKKYKAQYKALPHNWDSAIMPWNWLSWDAPFAERLTIDHVALMSSALSYEFKATRGFGFDKGIDTNFDASKGQKESDASRLIHQLIDSNNFNNPQRLGLLLLIGVRGGLQSEIISKVLLPKKTSGEIKTELLPAIESAGFIAANNFAYSADSVAPDAYDKSITWYLAKRSLGGGKSSKIFSEQRITIDLPTLQDTGSDIFMDGMLGSIAGVKFGNKAYDKDEYYNTTWLEDQVSNNKASNTLLPNLEEFKGQSRQGKLFAVINSDEQQANIYASSLPIEGVNYFSDGTVYRSGAGIIQGLALRITWAKDSFYDDNEIVMALGIENFLINDFQMVAPKSTLAIGSIAMQGMRLTINQNHLNAPGIIFNSARMTARVLLDVLPDVLKLLPYAVMTMTEEFSGAKAHTYKDKLGAIMSKDFYSLKSSLSFTGLEVKNLYDTKAGFMDDFSIEKKDKNGLVRQTLNIQETNYWNIDAEQNIKKRIKTIEEKIRAKKAEIGGNDLHTQIAALEKEDKMLLNEISEKGLKYEPRDEQMKRWREVRKQLKLLNTDLEKQFSEAKENHPLYNQLHFKVWYAEIESLQNDLTYLDDHYFDDVEKSKSDDGGVDRYQARKRKSDFEAKYKSFDVEMHLQGITLKGGNYVRDLINDSLKSMGFISPSLEGVENIKIGEVNSAFVASGKGASTLSVLEENKEGELTTVVKPGVAIRKLQIPLIKAPALAFKTGSMLLEAGSPRLENVFASVIIDFGANPLDRDPKSPYKYKLESLWIGKADFYGITLKIGEAPPLLDFPNQEPVEVWGLKMWDYDPDKGNINISIRDVKAKGTYADKNPADKSSKKIGFGIDTTLDNDTEEGKKHALVVRYNKEDESVVTQLNLASVWIPTLDIQSPTLSISSLAEANAIELKNVRADVKVLLKKEATETEKERPMIIEIINLDIGELGAQGIKVVMKEDLSKPPDDPKKKLTKKVQEVILSKDKQVSIKNIHLSGLRITLNEAGTTISKIGDNPALSLGETDLGGIKYIEKNTKGNVLSALSFHHAAFDSLDMKGAIAVAGREYNMKEFLKFFGSTRLEGLDIGASYNDGKTSASIGIKGKKNKAISIDYHPGKDEQDRGYYDIRLPLAKINVPALNIIHGNHTVTIPKPTDKSNMSYMSDVDVKLRAYIEFAAEDKVTYDIYLDSLDIADMAVYGLEYHNPTDGIDVIFDKLTPLHLPNVKAGGFRFSSSKGFDVFGKAGGWLDIAGAETAIDANFEKIQARLADGGFLAEKDGTRSALALDIAFLGFTMDQDGNKIITLKAIHGGFPKMTITQKDPKTGAVTATVLYSKDKTVKAESVVIKLNADGSKVIDATGMAAGDIILASASIKGSEKSSTTVTLGADSIGAASANVKLNADGSKEITLTDIKGGKINADFISSGSKGKSENHIILPDPELISIEIIKINIDKEGNKLITIQKPTIRNFKLDVPSQTVVGDYMSLLCDLTVNGNIEMGEGNFDALTLTAPFDAFVLKVSENVPVEVNNLHLEYKDSRLIPPMTMEEAKPTEYTSDQLKLIELEKTLSAARQVKDTTREYNHGVGREPIENPAYERANDAYAEAKNAYDQQKSNMIANAKGQAKNSKTKKYLDAFEGKVNAKLFLYDSFLDLNVETFSGEQYVEITDSMVSSIHNILISVITSTANASFWNSDEIKTLAKVLNGKWATYATPTLSGYLNAMIKGNGVGTVLKIIEDADLSKGTYEDDANLFGININLNSSAAMNLFGLDEKGVVGLCEKKYKHPSKNDFYNLYGIIEQLGYVSPALASVSGQNSASDLAKFLEGNLSEDDIDDKDTGGVASLLGAYIGHCFQREFGGAFNILRKGFKGLGITADVSLKPEEVINVFLKEKQAGKLNFDKGKKSIDNLHIDGAYLKDPSNKSVGSIGTGASGEGNIIIPGATYTSQDNNTKVSYESLEISKIMMSHEDDVLKVLNKSIALKSLKVGVRKK